MKMTTDKPYWQFKAAATEGVGELYIYGDIVRYRWDDNDTSAQSFKKDLDALGDIHTLNLYINSPGGSVFEGVAIHNILKRHKAKINVYVDALAASIASVIAMAGDTITMPSNAMMMIHNPWTITWGNAAELRKTADDLDRIGLSMRQTYLDRAGNKLTEDKLIEMLDAETWLSAEECQELGFCDVVSEENQSAACISEELFSQYKNVPDALKSQRSGKPPENADDAETRRLFIEEANADLEKIQSILGGLKHEPV